MKLLDYVRARMWIPVLGYGFYVAALTAGYYNLTFVQLGLVDQAPDWSGRRDVSMAMVVLAVIAFAVTVANGVVMDRRRWSTNLHFKIRLLLVIVTTQLALTLIAPAIRTPGLPSSPRPSNDEGGHGGLAAVRILGIRGPTRSLA